MHKPIIEDFPHILHGGDYNPDQWWGRHPDIIDEDFVLMPQAGCNAFSLAIFAWARLEPAPGEFHFDWLDDILDRCAAQGFKVLLATPTGGKPNWLAQAHPEVCRVTAEGRRLPQNERHNHCPSSPVMRERAAILIKAMAERYSDHPAVGGWHISNEIQGECHCDYCYANFRTWLKEKYGTLDNLNECWWTYFWSRTYTDWEQIHPEDASFDALRLDWHRFTTQQLIDFMQHEIDCVRQYSSLPVTTNFMGFHPEMD
jgi:beta-galactosidase